MTPEDLDNSGDTGTKVYCSIEVDKGEDHEAINLSVNSCRTVPRKESCLTVSDWVTFLSNEKQANMSTFLGFTSVIVALFAVTQGTENTGWKGWEKILAYVGTAFVLSFAFWQVSKRLDKRYKDAQDILSDIMSGKLTKEQDVRERWKAVEAKNTKGS